MTVDNAHFRAVMAAERVLFTAMGVDPAGDLNSDDRYSIRVKLLAAVTEAHEATQRQALRRLQATEEGD